MNKKNLTMFGVVFICVCLILGMYFWKEKEIGDLKKDLNEKIKLEEKNGNDGEVITKVSEVSDSELQVKNERLEKQIDDYGWYTFLYEEGNQIKSSRYEDDYEALQNISSLAINKEAGVVVAVVKGERVCEDEMYPTKQYQQILKVLIPNEKELYKTENQKGDGCLFNESFYDLELSPDGKYTMFYKSAWEWYKPYLINNETGKFVFGEESNIWIISEMVWSNNSNNYALITAVNEMGGEGELSVVVSKYNNPDEYEMIWKSKDYLMEEVRNIEFVKDNQVKFEIVPRDSRAGTLMEKGVWWEYDLKSGELKEM